MARRGSWPTPRAEDSESSGAHGPDRIDTLTSAVRRWPTPIAGDADGSGSRNTEGSKAHAGTSLTDAVRGDGGVGRAETTELRLNPEFAELLMMLPKGWTGLESLQNMWRAPRSEVDRNKAGDGASVNVQSPSLLQPQSHGNRHDESDRQDGQPQVAEAQEEVLRDVRRDKPTRYTSQGRGPRKQCTGEQDDSLPELSHEVALGQRKGDTTKSNRLLCLLCRREANARDVSGTLRPNEKVRESICPCASFPPERWPALYGLQVSVGVSQHWFEVPRALPATAMPTAIRRARLKAIGNGQVPRCAAEAFSQLVTRAYLATHA